MNENDRDNAKPQPQPQDRSDESPLWWTEAELRRMLPNYGKPAKAAKRTRREPTLFDDLYED